MPSPGDGHRNAEECEMNKAAKKQWKTAVGELQQVLSSLQTMAELQEAEEERYDSLGEKAQEKADESGEGAEVRTSDPRGAIDALEELINVDLGDDS